VEEERVAVAGKEESMLHAVVLSLLNYQILYKVPLQVPERLRGTLVGGLGLFGDYVITTYEDAVITNLRSAESRVVIGFLAPEFVVTMLGRLAIVGNNAGGIIFIHMEKQEVTRTLMDGHSQTIADIVLNNRYRLTGSEDGQVLVWMLE
jgi:hypothetical protein